MGYTGGTTPSPTYHNLGDHTESLQVDFDPAKLRYEDLLAIFWASHDPTRGTWCAQYKAAVFFHDDEQKRAAEKSRDEVSKRVGAVKTELLPLGHFTNAEDYHQKYALRGSELSKELLEVYADPVKFRESTAAARLNSYCAGHGTREQLERELPKLGLSERAQRELRAELAARGR